LLQIALDTVRENLHNSLCTLEKPKKMVKPVKNVGAVE
jgi:hypothetical protein